MPAPVPGLVIRYSYLWASEHAWGQEEGVKDRPCAVVLATTEAGQVMTVLRGEPRSKGGMTMCSVFA